MGADLLTTFLWCKKDEDGEPLLDWDAGRAVAGTVREDKFPLELDSGDVIQDQEGLTEVLLERLEKLKESLTWGREVEVREFETGLLLFVTGGMSWGDSPTDAYSIWGDFWDLPGGGQILAAVGFLPEPYRVIGVVA